MAAIIGTQICSFSLFSPKRWNATTETDCATKFMWGTNLCGKVSSFESRPRKICGKAKMPRVCRPSLCRRLVTLVSSIEVDMWKLLAKKPSVFQMHCLHIVYCLSGYTATKWWVGILIAKYSHWRPLMASAGASEHLQLLKAFVTCLTVHPNHHLVQPATQHS